MMFECPRSEFYDLIDEFIKDCSMCASWNTPDEKGHFIDLTALVQNVTYEVYGAVDSVALCAEAQRLLNDAPVPERTAEDLDHIADANAVHYASNKMTPSAYIESCLKTESPTFFQPRSMEEFRYMMGNLVITVQHLDAFKKAMFYGKEMEDEALVIDPDLANDPAELDIDVRLLHGVIGLATEAGELVEAVYKHIFNGHELDTRNLYEETGDAMYYQSLILKYLGVTWEETMHDNHKKRMKRYEGGVFTKEAAVNRDVESELQEMTESGNLQKPEQE